MTVPTRKLFALGALLAVPALAVPTALAAGAGGARDVLEAFEKTFEEAEGYMRPAGDDGWQARFLALRELVLLGESATPVLAEALASENDQVRILAAQALSFIGAEAALEALERALRTDADPAVRLYAADALGVIGGPRVRAALQHTQAEDRNGDVKAHAGFALERTSPDVVADVRDALAAFDPRALDRARLGEPAPPLVLDDHAGRRFDLAALRGRKIALVVFIYGDT